MTAAALVWAGGAVWGQLPDPSDPVGVVQGPAGWPVNTRVLWDRCGGEGDRACTPADPSYALLPEGLPGFRCDRTLSAGPAFPPVDGVPLACIDIGNRSKADVRARLDAKVGAQQDDQYDRISADLPLNFVPILGTHNSYSNAADGAESQFSQDHIHSITDQLWLGARHIRLDPMGDGYRQLLCHMSPGVYDLGVMNALRAVTGNVPTTDIGMCYVTLGSIMPAPMHGRISLDRPFYLALREIRKWLDRNPGAVIFVNVNNFWPAGNLAYIDPDELEAVIEHELGPKMFPYQTWPNSPSNRLWPTLRQVRAAGRQVLVRMANRGSSGRTWPADDVTHSTSDRSFATCGPSGSPMGISEKVTALDPAPNTRQRPDQIGEDRSIANQFVSGNGQISYTDMDLIAYCGYNQVGLDFFYALNEAPYIAAMIDYRDGQRNGCTACDERPAKMIWSWQRDQQPVAGRPVTLRSLLPPVNDGNPATVADTLFYRWTQAGESTGLPYACAHRRDTTQVFPDAANAWAYLWTITEAKGPWKYGEAECQKLGPNYHFWRPMSAPENRRLIETMKATLTGQVWLNHLPGRTAALPGVLDAAFDAASDFNESVVVTSGYGGRITAQFIGPSNGPQFLTVAPQGSAPNLFTISKTPNLPAQRLGSYTGTIRFTETRPDGSGEESSDVTVTMKETGVPALHATPFQVGFQSGVVQQVQIVSSNPGAGEVAFQVAPVTGADWLTAAVNRTTTPAVLTLTANPALAGGSDTTGVRLTGRNGNPSSLTIPVSISTARVTVQTAPAPLPVQVDGVEAPAPRQMVWVAGSTHALAARPTFEADGAVYVFNGWDDGVATPARSVSTTADKTYTAKYLRRFRLTLTAVPANGGTVAVQNPSADGTYAEGTKVLVAAQAAAGFVFRQFQGDATSQQSPVTVGMNGPKSIQAQFVAAQGQTRLVTNPVGLQVTVDGVAYATPASFAWAPGETHSVAAPVQAGGTAGVRYVFASWGDGGVANPRLLGGSASDVTYTLNFATQYELKALVSPSAAGTLTGGGWYAPNTVVPMAATAASGFVFSGFSGAAQANGAAASATLSGPLTVTANFKAQGQPVLFAASSGRTDLGGGVVAVPIVLTNLGSGPAGDAVITSIDGFSVLAGGGAVSAPLPVGGASVGTIAVRGSGQTTVHFLWPATATRISFTVRFRANGGAYTGSNSISLFRP